MLYQKVKKIKKKIKKKNKENKEEHSKWEIRRIEDVYVEEKSDLEEDDNSDDVVVWQWESDNQGIFNLFSKSESKKLEKAFKKDSKGETLLKIKDKSFKYSFYDFIQTSKETGSRRKIKRVTMSQDEFYIFLKVSQGLPEDTFFLKSDHNSKEEKKHWLNFKKGDRIVLTGINIEKKLGKGHLHGHSKIGLFKLKYFEYKVEVHQKCSNCSVNNSNSLKTNTHFTVFNTPEKLLNHQHFICSDCQGDNFYHAYDY